jgi:putative ABC transport system permease protein
MREGVDVREIRIPGIKRVLRISWSDRAMRREISDEIAFHIEARTEELIGQGMSRHDAHERAEAEYGDVRVSEREILDVDRRRHGHEQREELMHSLADDLRFAARGVARRPALLAVTTLALSVGIAANAIMFGIVDQLLLQPPAGVARPDRVKRVFFRDHYKGEPSVQPITTYPVVTALREHVPAFSEVAAFGSKSDWSLGTGAGARSVTVQLVSGNYFRLLGVTPERGRTFTDDEDRAPNGEMVAMVSHDFWNGALASTSDVVGRTLRLQGKVFTIVGVAPKEFAGVDRNRVDIWIPISSVASETLGETWYNKPNNWWATIIGRLRDGATPEVAADQATAAYRGLIREWKDQVRDSTSSIVLSTLIATRTPNGLSAESKVSLWLMGVSAIVLLIACANVANLLIARTVQRRREIAVRLALGVSRGRLMRLLMTEAGLLAAIAAAIAVAVTYVASGLVQRVLLPTIVWRDNVFDGRVLAITVIATVTCILLAGLAPALEGAATRVADNLKAAARQVAGGRGRLRFALMTLQAGLSVVLLIGAGLFVVSLRNVVTRDVGLDRDRVLQVTMPLRRFGFDTTQIEDIYRRAIERTRVIPGVVTATIARMSVPYGNLNASGFEVPGVEPVALKGGGPYNAIVGAGFFETVGAPVLRGRDFTIAESRSPARVAIVNESLANAYWPGADPVGHCVKVFRDSTCSEIVGVVHNVMQFGVVEDFKAIVYVPPSHPAVHGAPPLAMLVRVSRDPAAIVPLVRRELQRLNANMPYVEARPYAELVAWQLQPWRLGASMFTLFGVIALVIAAVGLYSVMSFWVLQRTHEIGVRVALGAQRADVVRLVAWESSRPVFAGLLLGAATAALASRWIGPLLYETSPRSPIVYVGATLVLAVAAIAASVIPARRSVAIDPALAMRAD